MDIRIGEVVTDMTITEAVGALSPEEVKRLVAIVLEQVRREQDRASQQKRDREITDRVSRN
jgi:hypothetical protein